MILSRLVMPSFAGIAANYCRIKASNFMLDTRYNHAKTEDRIYKFWVDNNCFRSAVDATGTVLDSKRAQADPYVIAIPPPNVTGRLHMGHALNNTFQDILIRYKRMDGFDALWVPGTDHAGIATQTVVKKMLDEEGVDYHDLGREKFVEKVWEWKARYGDMILHQLEQMGCSCDWARTRFTMDKELYRAVVYTFVKLYEEGLIYRGERIVNWCPVDKTALSDDEVETREGGEPGFLWRIRYPLADGSGHLVVATTRPETLFGDVAVAVNPKDERYQKYIGKKVIVPLQKGFSPPFDKRLVPIIADEYVDMAFGTGALKITPAHDPNDFEIGRRHNLASINVMNEDATMNDAVPKRYQGLDRFKCRERVVDDLKRQGLLEGEEERLTPVGRSYRSGAIIEYRLSKQWFVRMQPLADKVLKMHDQLNIQPARWNKVYLDWLHNIKDWCISRQIWWGHRIPVWYCENSEERMPEKARDGKVKSLCDPIVSEGVPNQCPKCKSTDLKQEEDVLDTWFSSALWPMSTLGWPEKTPDFQRYFPTTTLVTGKDIIFFWVARMNMMAAHFEGRLPYKNVFINPIVLDERGETMSKSKGNGIDPLVIINGATLKDLEQPVREARPSNMKEMLSRLKKNFPNGYEGVGADALRYTLIYLCSSGQQLKVSLNAFQELGRRFMTKLWNASRFILMYIEQEDEKGGETPEEFGEKLTDEDRWILARAQRATNRIRACFDKHDFTNLGQIYYHYVWNDFCDWYVELSKVRLTSKDATQRKTALHNLVVVFARTLALLHPLIPFVTEELWQKLLPMADKHGLWGEARPASKILMQAAYPKARHLSAGQEEIIARFDKLQKFVTAIRTLRKSYHIKDAERLSASAVAFDKVADQLLDRSRAAICRLANLDSLTKLGSKDEKPPKSVTLIDPSFEIYLDISKYIDVAAEKKRLGKQIEKLEKQVNSLNKRLQNKAFLENANPRVVEDQTQSLARHQEQLKKLNDLLKEITSWK